MEKSDIETEIVNLVCIRYIFCYGLLMPLLGGALLPPSVIYHLNMTHSLGVQSIAQKIFFFFPVPY